MLTETGKAVAIDGSGLDFSAMESRRTYRLATSCVTVGREARDSGLPALVFVAGAYHGGWCYSHYLDYFARHAVDCVAVDLPGQCGHGRPWRDAVGLTIADQVDALHEVCAYLDRPLVLVGHSMGALPVMGVAGRRSVHGVVLLAPSPPGNLPGALPVPPVATGALVAPPDEATVRRRFLDVDDAMPVDGLLQRLTPASPEMLNDRYLLRYEVAPADIACPGICFEAGLDDDTRHPHGQDKAVAEFFGFEYRMLAEQPHSMMYGPRWQASAGAIHQWYLRHVSQ